MTKYNFADLEDTITNDDFTPDIVFVAEYINKTTSDLIIDADNGRSYVFLNEDKGASPDLRIWVPVKDSEGRNACLMTASIVSMVAA